MPYIVRKRTGKKPWKIIKKSTGQVVGSSTSKAKALRSIGYRESGDKK